MAINNKPIFTGTPQISWSGSIVTANTAADIMSGTTYLAFTADATNGGYIQKIRFRAIGTSAQATVTTSARIWLNNGSTVTTGANSVLIDEISLPSVTVSLTSASSNYEIPLNFAIPAGYKIYVTIGVTQTAATWYATVFGGSYVAQA